MRKSGKNTYVLMKKRKGKTNVTKATYNVVEMMHSDNKPIL
jgi:hypothetical protein